VDADEMSADDVTSENEFGVGFVLKFKKTESNTIPQSP
jgi:hypothetical protein